MKRSGFTIVELIIVITVMAILLVLGVVNLRGTQINARDDERRGDIQSLSLSLENFYISGWDSNAQGGSYPWTTFMTTNDATTIKMLRDINSKTLLAPGVTSISASFVPATNSTQTTAGVTPQPTISQYVYQAIRSDGGLCTQTDECRKFNLYYRAELDNSVNMVTSKNQ